MDIEEATRIAWGGAKTPEHIEKSYGRTRDDRRCVQLVLQQILDENGIIPTAKHLEIGCGIGELMMLLPTKFSPGFTFLDYNLWNLHHFPEMDWPLRKVAGNVIKLPFSAGNFDYVWGYASYDTFYDLPLAVSETARILKHGGLFIHILDIDVGVEPIIIHVTEHEYLYPLPSVVGVEGIYFLNGMYLLSGEQFEKLFTEVRRKDGTREFLQTIKISPVTGFLMMLGIFDRGGIDRKGIIDFAKFVKRHSPSPPVTFRQYFENQMRALLPSSGIEILQAGGVWSEIQYFDSPRGKIVTDHGGVTTSIGFGKGISRFRKNVHVIIGQKQL